jgi:putative transposase
VGRIARVIIPGIPHHITQRGNHREAVFFADEDLGFTSPLLPRTLSAMGRAFRAFV